MNQQDLKAKERQILVELQTAKPGPHRNDLIKGLNNVRRKIKKMRKEQA